MSTVSPEEFMRAPGYPARRSREPSLISGNTPWAQDYMHALKDVIIRYAGRLPRTLQRHLGPSELGYECDRMVVGKMAGVPKVNHLMDPWAAIVGTAIHAFMDSAFTWDNQASAAQRGGYARWRTEGRVTPDPGAASPHPGTADLYDFEHQAVTDWKGIMTSTPVPTPSGWTTMGELREGDEVFGADGAVCRVTCAYPVQYRDCYRVTFKNGASIVTDDVQEWRVRRNRNGGASARNPETVILSAAEMRDQVFVASGQRHLRVSNAGALELPEAVLPADPYVLGCWIGDGERGGGQVCKPDDDLFENIRARGYHVGKPLPAGGAAKRTVFGLLTQLQRAGVVSRTGSKRYLGIKRIPLPYLRASRTQRLALLRGLMDTGGSYNKTRNQCAYTTTGKDLAEQVRELVATLGWKPYVCTSVAHGFGVTTTAYEVTFTAFGDNPFALPRKASLVRLAGTTLSRYRLVQSVEPVLTVPTRCVDVDSADHMYLAGEYFIPVHNCQGDSVRARLRSQGPPRHYFVQLLLYAIGYMYLGYPVKRVVLVSLPRTKSTLDDAYAWAHDITAADLAFAGQVLRQAQARERVAAEVTAGRVSIWQVPAIPGPDTCAWCPLFRPQSAVDGQYGCPGTLLAKP